MSFIYLSTEIITLHSQKIWSQAIKHMACGCDARILFGEKPIEVSSKVHLFDLREPADELLLANAEADNCSADEEAPETSRAIPCGLVKVVPVEGEEALVAVGNLAGEAFGELAVSCSMASPIASEAVPSPRLTVVIGNSASVWPTLTMQSKAKGAGALQVDELAVERVSDHFIGADGSQGQLRGQDLGLRAGRSLRQAVQFCTTTNLAGWQLSKG